MKFFFPLAEGFFFFFYVSGDGDGGVEV